MDATLVKTFLDTWHLAVEKKTVQIMADFVCEDVKLVSPALFHPKVGKAVVMELLGDVAASLERYTVTKTWQDGAIIMLEFDAKVKHYSIQGIDRIILNEQGKISELKVYIRPFSGLKALSQSVLARQVARMESAMSPFEKLVFRLKIFLKKRK